MLSTSGRVSPNLREGRLSIFRTYHHTGDRSPYLVRTILIKALIELVLVTMCALPLYTSVTTMTDQPNSRKLSKV